MQRPDGIGDRKVVLWALAGSRNQGTAVEGSDEDRIALVMPSFDDLYRSRQYHGQTVTPSGDISVHDVRSLPDMVGKANPAFLEALFSVDLWVPEGSAMEDVLEMRGRLAAANLPGLWNACIGTYRSRMERLERGTSSTAHLVESFGYDTKQAMQAVRMLNLLRKFRDSGFSDFGGALRAGPAEREALLAIRDGAHSLDGFREMAAGMLEDVESIRECYRGAPVDREALDILDGIVMGMVRGSLVPGTG